MIGESGPFSGIGTMRGDMQKPQQQSLGVGGQSEGLFPNSMRGISSYWRFVSSCASTVASTVRSAGASMAFAVAADRDNEPIHDLAMTSRSDCGLGGGIARISASISGGRSWFSSSLFRLPSWSTASATSWMALDNRAVEFLPHQRHGLSDGKLLVQNSCRTPCVLPEADASTETGSNSPLVEENGWGDLLTSTELSGEFVNNIERPMKESSHHCDDYVSY